MTIDELLKKASPRPWDDSTEHDPLLFEINKKLCIHCVNNFERMIEALTKIADDSGHHCGNSGYDPCTCNQDIARKALKEIEK